MLVITRGYPTWNWFKWNLRRVFSRCPIQDETSGAHSSRAINIHQKHYETLNIYSTYRIPCWLVVLTILKNDGVRQSEGLSHIYIYCEKKSCLKPSTRYRITISHYSPLLTTINQSLTTINQSLISPVPIVFRDVPTIHMVAPRWTPHVSTAFPRKAHPRSIASWGQDIRIHKLYIYEIGYVYYEWIWYDICIFMINIWFPSLYIYVSMLYFQESHGFPGAPKKQFRHQRRLDQHNPSGWSTKNTSRHENSVWQNHETYPLVN